MQKKEFETNEDNLLVFFKESKGLNNEYIVYLHIVLVVSKLYKLHINDIFGTKLVKIQTTIRY